MEYVEDLSAIAFYQDLLILIGLVKSSNLLHIVPVYFIREIRVM